MEERKIKVLFIDDDILLGQIVTTDLKEEGYEAIYQTSLAGAKACVAETHPDIIVLDVEIGEKNGIDIAPELQAFAPEMPILFTSSHTDSETVVKALNAGAVAYIKKPFEMPELRAYIRRHAQIPHSPLLSIHSLSLDTKTRELMKGEKRIKQLERVRIQTSQAIGYFA